MNKTLRCILLDEDEDQLENLKIKLKGLPWVEVVGVYLDSGTFISDLAVLPPYDVLISDIDMPGFDGFEVARSIDPQLVLFVTGFPDKGIDYSSVPNSIGVLKKPVKLDSLQAILKKYQNELFRIQEIWLSVAEIANDRKNVNPEKDVREFTKKKVHLDEIALVQTTKEIKLPPGDCHMILKGGRQFRVINKSLTTLENDILNSPKFIRVSDSVIINVECVDKIEGKKGNELIMNVKNFEDKFFKCYVSDANLKNVKTKLGF